MSFDVVTEENKASILGKVGWGAVGTLALGPLGLLAGVLGGGNRRDRVMVIETRDGRKAMLKGTAKDAEMLMAATFGGGFQGDSRAKPAVTTGTAPVTTVEPSSFRADRRPLPNSASSEPAPVRGVVIALILFVVALGMTGRQLGSTAVTAAMLVMGAGIIIALFWRVHRRQGLLMIVGGFIATGVASVAISDPSARAQPATAPATQNADARPQQPAAPVATPIAPTLPTWRVREETSRMDDSRSVFLTVQSTNDIRGRFSGRGPATLIVRCVENTTSAIFQFNENFMTDIQSYGQVTYRIDDAAAQTRRFRASTNNMALGLWSGGESIPFARSLFDANTLFVRATPFNENAVEAEFNVAGLADVIAPLREACNW